MLNMYNGVLNKIANFYNTDSELSQKVIYNLNKQMINDLEILFSKALVQKLNEIIDIKYLYYYKPLKGYRLEEKLFYFSESDTGNVVIKHSNNSIKPFELEITNGILDDSNLFINWLSNNIESICELYYERVLKEYKLIHERYVTLESVINSFCNEYYNLNSYLFYYIKNQGKHIYKDEFEFTIEVTQSNLSVLCSIGNGNKSELVNKITILNYTNGQLQKEEFKSIVFKNLDKILSLGFENTYGKNSKYHKDLINQLYNKGFYGTHNILSPYDIGKISLNVYPITFENTHYIQSIKYNPFLVSIEELEYILKLQQDFTTLRFTITPYYHRENELDRKVYYMEDRETLSLIHSKLLTRSIEFKNLLENKFKINREELVNKFESVDTKTYVKIVKEVKTTKGTLYKYVAINKLETSKARFLHFLDNNLISCRKFKKLERIK